MKAKTARGSSMLNNNWKKSKALPGKYPAWISDTDVDANTTQQWLTEIGLRAETEGLMKTAQDQCVSTRIYYKNILRNCADHVCRS